MSKNINWPQIRMRWESGETSYSISKDTDVSHQGIDKKAKRENWVRKSKDSPVNWLEKADETYIVASKSSPLRTRETIATILDLISRGSPEKYAAGTVGMSPTTLARWKKEDPTFAAQMAQARNHNIAQKIIRIDEAGRKGHFKADIWALEKSRETRDEFSGRPANTEPVEFRFSFDRAPADEKVVCDVSPEEIVDNSVQGNGVSESVEDRLPYDGPRVFPKKNYITRK